MVLLVIEIFISVISYQFTFVSLCLGGSKVNFLTTIAVLGCVQYVPHPLIPSPLAGLRCTHKSSDPPKSPFLRGTLILVPPFLRGVRGDQNATRQLYKTSVYTAGKRGGEVLRQQSRGGVPTVLQSSEKCYKTLRLEEKYITP